MDAGQIAQGQANQQQLQQQQQQMFQQKQQQSAECIKKAISREVRASLSVLEFFLELFVGMYRYGVPPLDSPKCASSFRLYLTLLNNGQPCLLRRGYGNRSIRIFSLVRIPLTLLNNGQHG